MTLASLQRGNLSLHASTVQIGDEVVALAGHQGAGKSTTAMGLRARGHRLLVDDTTVVEFRDDGAWTTPYARNVHLLPRRRRRARGRRRRAARPRRPARQGRVPGRGTADGTPSDRPHRGAHPTQGHDRGDPRADCAAPTASGCSGNTSAASASHQAILGQPAFFALLAELADAAPVQLLRRPPDDWTLDAVLDAIEAGRAEPALTAGLRPTEAALSSRRSPPARQAPRTPWSP